MKRETVFHDSRISLHVSRFTLHLPLARIGRVWHNTQDMSRWFRFILAIMIGAVLGALYGWLVSPVKYVETAPDSLSIDYKTDYVLMVAESYQAEPDISLASQRLALLGKESPAEIVRKALLFAENHYTDPDIARIRSLSDALQTPIPSQETISP